MPEFHRTYDFGQVLCTVGGFEISGWAEDGGIEFEQGGDVAEHVVGAAGEVFTSRSNDKRLTASITVMQNSQGAADLGRLLNAQESATGPIPKVNFYCRNFVTGEIIQDPQAIFIARPDTNQSASATERVFQILLPYAANKIEYGTPSA